MAAAGLGTAALPVVWAGGGAAGVSGWLQGWDSASLASVAAGKGHCRGEQAFAAYPVGGRPLNGGEGAAAWLWRPQQQ